MDRQQGQEKALQAIMRDLVDALFQENIGGLAKKGRLLATSGELASVADLPLAGDESLFGISLAPESDLVFRVQSEGFLQDYRFSRLPAVLIVRRDGGHKRTLLMPADVLRLLVQSGSVSYPNLDGICEDLQRAEQHYTLALQATELVLAALPEERQSLFWLERLASLRDRPFHPTAYARSGWDEMDYYQYSAAYGQSFLINWVAVRRDYIKAAAGLGPQTPAQFLLTDDEEMQLEEAMHHAGVSVASYIALPVHPWQMRHVLPQCFADEFQQRIFVPVPLSTGAYRATSSVRSLVAGAVDQPHHLKLPLGIVTLGALRLLPGRYLENGQKGQQLLQQLMDHDPYLRETLRYCDEGRWWAFDNPAEDAFADKPGHLACQLRRYPVSTEEHTQLVPMNALTVNGPEGNVLFAQLTGKSTHETSTDDVLAFFQEICATFLRVAFTCAHYGVMPELHGQNALLLFRAGHVEQLILRDHDTLRIYPPWLKEAGVADPGYTVKPGTQNTLMNQSPEELLSYAQTLGIQVNLYAIACALRDAYAVPERLFWQMIRASVEQVLHTLALPTEQHQLLSDHFLVQDRWPLKLFLLPLLQRQGSGGGSMPSASGTIYNPLRRIERTNK